MLSVNSYSFNNFKTRTQPKPVPVFNPNKLSIFYYNDTHGNTDQMAGVVESAKNFKNKNLNCDSFVLSAGDNCSGANVKKNGLIFNIMQNLMGVDVSAIGNHELDGGSDGFMDAMKGKNFSFVATNVKFDDDNPMKNHIKKSIIKEQNGTKYGFIGAMPIDFKDCTKESSQKGLEVMDFEDTVEALQEEINNLKKQGVNKIILVSHIGYDADKALVSNLDGIDIVIGGHSHSVVEGAQNGENILLSKSKEPVIITQAGENGKYYGVLDVEFDNNGVIKALNNKLVKNLNRAKSPTIEYIKTSALGKSPKVATLSQIDPMPENRRIEPCAWTNLIADSMKNELGADVALINSANIRKVPGAGVVTEADIQESTPMKNKLLKTKITQKQLIDAIKSASTRTMQATDGYPGLLMASGINYKIDDLGNLLELNFVDKEGKNNPIDINNPSEDITYSAIYDDFVAKAGGEYPELEPKFEVEHFEFDKDKTMTDYISKMQNKESLNVTDDKRIEIIKTSKQKPQGNNSRSFLNLSAPKAS